MRKARSSSDQRAAGTPTVRGSVVARTRTLWRSAGGKGGGPAAARQVVQAVEAQAAEAPAPLGDGLGGAAEFGGDRLVGGFVGLSAAEDEACAEGEGLGGGVGVGQALEVEEVVGGGVEAWCFAGHGARSLCAGTAGGGDALKGRVAAESVQGRKRTRVSMLLE